MGDLQAVNAELELFSPWLARKPQVVVLNNPNPDPIPNPDPNPNPNPYPNPNPNPNPITRTRTLTQVVVLNKVDVPSVKEQQTELLR